MKKQIVGEKKRKKFETIKKRKIPPLQEEEIHKEKRR
jgi:hypothetical protein